LRPFQRHASLWHLQSRGAESLFVNWFWPRQLNSDDRISIRNVRLVHWCIVGFAAFGLVVSYIGLIEAGDAEPINYFGVGFEPINYFAVGFVWVALAMLGRGFRYVVARE
jgi:hypothetical protein